MVKMRVFKDIQDIAYLTVAKKGLYSKPEYSVEKSRMILVMDILRKYPADIFLDVGCGEGIYIKKLRNSYKFLIGLDFCRQALLDIKKEIGVENVELIMADVHHIPIKDGAVDLALSSEVIEHVENPSEVIRQISAVSRKYVVITVPIETNQKAKTTIDLLTKDSEVLKHQLQRNLEITKTTHIHEFSFAYIEQALVNSGKLEIVKKRAAAFTFLGSGNLRRSVYKSKILRVLWKFVETELLSRFLIFKANLKIMGNEFGVFLLARKFPKSKAGV
jgi:ubiquinone/menaquinone biosynthesis C-methylase UbiE